MKAKIPTIIAIIIHIAMLVWLWIAGGFPAIIIAYTLVFSMMYLFYEEDEKCH